MRKLATLLFVLAATSPVDAKPKPKASVKAHMDKAAKAHKAGKFDVALSELQAAYAIDPQPKLLFAIAQVYAKLDNCEAAIEHYEKFSAATKDKDKQAVVQQAVEACKKKLEEKAAAKPDKPDKGEGVFRAKKPADDQLPTADVKPEPKPEPKVEATPTPPGEPPVETKPAEEHKPEIKAFEDPPPPAKPAPVPVPVATVTAQPTTKAWYRDVIGDALVISGVGATITSVFTYRSALDELDEADHATALADYDTHRHNAERKQLYTWALAGGGLALVTAGVLRYSLRNSRREASGVAIVPSDRGGLITWSGGF